MAAPISSQRTGLQILSWVFALVWLSITINALLNTMHNPGKAHLGNIAILLLFLAIGIWQIWRLVRAKAIEIRYGNVLFQPETDDFAIGGPLRGTISFARKALVQVGPEFVVALSCMEARTSGTVETTSTSRTPLWTKIVPVRAAEDGTVPLSFFIPEHSRTASGSMSDGIYWQIEIREAQDRSLPFSATFIVPIVKRNLTPEEEVAAAPGRAEHAREVAAYRPPTNSPVVIRPCGIDDTEFFFPPGLNRKVGLTNLPFLVAFGGAAAFLWFHAPVFVTTIFALVAAIIFYATLQTFCGSMRTVAGRDGITVTRALLGWTWTRRLQAESIKGFKTAVRMTSGKTAYRTILAVLTSGNDAALSPNLENATEAEWIAAEMEKKVRG